MSALIFKEGRLAPVRKAWREERIVPIVCRETARELVRVLAYPKFKLSRADQEELLGDFLPFAETFTLPAKWPAVPECRDTSDTVFLALGKAAKADAIVTGDSDLLELKNRFSIPILRADDLLKKLG